MCFDLVFDGRSPLLFRGVVVTRAQLCRNPYHTGDSLSHPPKSYSDNHHLKSNSVSQYPNSDSTSLIPAGASDSQQVG
jgi:hypothetical protein